MQTADVCVHLAQKDQTVVVSYENKVVLAKVPLTKGIHQLANSCTELGAYLVKNANNI